MKKIIFFVLLLSLVSEGSKAQTAPGLKDPSATGMLKRTTLSQTVIATPGTDYVIPSALTAKQATLVSGTNIKTINGTTILGSGDLTIAGGSGGASYKPYTSVAYSSTINLNFDATNYTNVTGVTGNITFTASNNTNGKPFVVSLKKTGTGVININFDPTTIPNPRLKSYTTLAKGFQVSPYHFTLAAGAGEYILVFDNLIDGPRIVIDNDPNLDNAVVQRANILNLKNFPSIADPGNTTAETAVNTFKIPAATLSDSSSLIIAYIYRRQSGSGQLQLKIRACSSAGQTLSTCPTIDDFGQSGSFGDYRRTAVLTNISISSNLVQPGYSEQQANYPIATTRSIDFSQDVYLKFTVEKQTSGSQVGGFLGVRINGEGL